MKVCWRWGVKDCPVLSYSPVTLQSCYQLSTSLPISSIINKRTACLFICPFPDKKANQTLNIFCIYILNNYFRNAGEHCSSYNNGYLGRHPSHRPQNGDSRELRGNGYTRHHDPDLQSSSCKLHGDLHCSGLVNFAPGFSPDTEVRITNINKSDLILPLLQDDDHEDSGLCPELIRAMEGVKYIAEVTRIVEDSNKVGCFAICLCLVKFVLVVVRFPLSPFLI